MGELYRRGMDAATDCLKLDESNAKALYRRALCKEALKLYDQALEDLAALEGRPDKSIGPDDAELSCLRERFQTKKEAHEKRLKEEGPDSDDETLELVTLKQRFDVVVDKYGLKDEESANEIADWLTRANSG